MNETFLQIGAESSAARLVVDRIGASPAVGVGQLSVSVAISSLKAGVEGKPLWIGGTVSVANLGPASGYLALLNPPLAPSFLQERGARSVVFTCDISNHQLHAIETHRTGSVQLSFDFAGYLMADGSPEQLWAGPLVYEVSQSDWISLLERIGYQRTLLLELPVPNVNGRKEYTQAIEYFQAAREQYLQQEWRLTVESLRQALAALAGTDADEQSDEDVVRGAVADLRKATMNRKVGYAERREPVRIATKFMCDLGAHPEAAETTRRDAYGALLIVAALLLD